MPEEGEAGSKRTGKEEWRRRREKGRERKRGFLCLIANENEPGTSYNVCFEYHCF